MGILLTTSKGPGSEARNLCRCLASILPGAVCESRGERSVDDVVARARLLGKTRIAFIHSRAGKPSGLHFARVRAASWEWLEPAFSVASARFAKPLEGQPESIALKGPRAGEWRNLLAAGEGDEGEAEADCRNDSVSFTSGKKIVAELVFG